MCATFADKTFVSSVDDETRLGQLCPVCLGPERTAAPFQEGPLCWNFRQDRSRRHHRRWSEHPVHHGTVGRLPEGKRLDCRKSQFGLWGERACVFVASSV